MNQKATAMRDTIARALRREYEVETYVAAPPALKALSPQGQAEVFVEIGEKPGYIISVSWENIDGEGAWSMLYQEGKTKTAQLILNQLALFLT